MSGIMRVCARMYLFKNKRQRTGWDGFAGVYSKPLRIGKYEPGATKVYREAMSQAVPSLCSDAAGIISKSTEIKFIEAQRFLSPQALQFYFAFRDRCWVDNYYSKMHFNPHLGGIWP